MSDEQAKKPDLKVVPPATPKDAQDIEALWLDPGLGDDITDTHWHEVPLDRPRDFFRVHPDRTYRRKTEMYVHKSEDEIEKQHFIVDPAMRGRIAEARICILVTCIYRDGRPRLWPIPFPREGEKDNSAWVSGRAAARVAIDKWIKLLWAKKSYQTREALPGYAPEPDWSKLPPFNDLARLAVGEHGIIRDTNHPIYRELMGAPAKKATDAGADLGDDNGGDDL
jgi:hypothetical protein